MTPDKGYAQADAKEREDLAEYQHDTEIIRRHDLPRQPRKTKPEFKDRQLEEALEYLRGQIKTASRAAVKKAS